MNDDLLLTTQRLRLEPLLRSHAPLMMVVLGNPQTHLFIPSDPPQDEKALAEQYARLESRSSPDGLQRWLNWVVFRTGDAIGTVQTTVYPEASADIAYVFHPNYWGQGYASEAVSELLRYLGENLGVRRFTAYTDTRNLASQRLLERLGFEREAFVKNADEFKGSKSDEYVYGLEK